MSRNTHIDVGILFLTLDPKTLWVLTNCAMQGDEDVPETLPEHGQKGAVA